VHQQDLDLEILFKPVPDDRLALQSKEDLILYIKLQQKFNDDLQRHVKQLEKLNELLQQKSLWVDDQLIVLKNKLFGKSSERSAKNANQQKSSHRHKRTKVQLPSLRYPDAPLIERDIDFKEAPQCSCCGQGMQDSGMTEDSEFLTVIPAQHLIIRQKRHKYRCGSCHGDVKTAPAPKRMKPGSGLSDEMMLDVSLSKYCDLIPIERYASMADRQGMQGLPRQTLIEGTHYVADFVEGVYKQLKEEIKEAEVLLADETPHRMLEGDKKSGWYLSGFSTPQTSDFDIRDTRSGDVASELLMKSKCRYLMSDVFSGYGKAARVTNESRAEQKKPLILNVYCNAHCRRKFKEASEKFPDEAQFFIDHYREIYQLEKRGQENSAKRLSEFRQQMIPHFQQMKDRAFETLKAYSSKSLIATAMNYLLSNFTEFTRFINHPKLPIDNNAQERQLRNPVIGRKTWYGTHSKRGARTAAILFSLIESCKLNKINPREYFKKLVQTLHEDKNPFTPKQFKNLESGP